jgi:hypothetical protein
LIDGSAGDNAFFVGPCHRAAAVWLHCWAEPSTIRVGQALILVDHEIGEFLTDATRAGFTLQFHVERAPYAEDGATPELWMPA